MIAVKSKILNSIFLRVSHMKTRQIALSFLDKKRSLEHINRDHSSQDCRAILLTNLSKTLWLCSIVEEGYQIGVEKLRG